jgi:HEAT repeat protein
LIFAWRASKGQREIVASQARPPQKPVDGGWAEVYHPIISRPESFGKEAAMFRLSLAVMFGALLLAHSASQQALAQDDDNPMVRGKKITEWVKILHDDPEPRKRQAALLILEFTGTKVKRIVPALLKEMRENSDDSIRARCAELVVKLKDDKDQTDRLIDPLIAAMRQDKSPAVREAAATSLGKLARGSTKEIPDLIEALKDKEPRVRAAAAEAIGQYCRADPEVAKDAIPQLTELLKDVEASVRVQSAFALGRMGPNAAPAVAVLAELTVKDKQASVRKEAAKTLAAIGPESRSAVQELVRALEDPQTDVRQHAALALGKIGVDASAAEPNLQKALKDKDQEVRCQAARALGGLGKAGLPALPELIRMLKDDDVAEVRIAVIQVLGEFGPDAKNAVDALSIASRDGRPGIREAAADALKKVQKAP